MLQYQALHRYSVNIDWLIHLVLVQDFGIWGSSGHKFLHKVGKEALLEPCWCASRFPRPSVLWVSPKGLILFGLWFWQWGLSLLWDFNYKLDQTISRRTHWVHTWGTMGVQLLLSLLELPHRYPEMSPVKVGQSGNSKPFSWNSK